MTESDASQESPPKARRQGARKGGAFIRRALRYGLLLAIAGAIVWGLWPKPMAVETAEAARGPMTVSVLEEGETRIRERYVVSPPIAGRLNRVALRAGAAVRAGETVLATIEPAAPGLLDARTRAEAEARLQALEAMERQRAADAERAAAELDFARQTLARVRALRERGLNSQQDADDAATEVRVLSQAVESAEYARRAAAFDAEQARAALGQFLGEDDGASQEVALVSPIDGRILEVFEESARTIAAGEPIMEIGDPRDLEVEVELLSSDAVGVEPGAEVAIEHWGGDDSLPGSVSLVEPGGFTKVSALGVEEQRVIVRVAFAAEIPAALGDRYRVEARIVTWQDEDVLQIPAGALFRRGGAWMAFVAAGDVAQLREIEVGHHNGLAAEVRSGLEAGDAVVLYPPEALEDGADIAPGPSESNEPPPQNSTSNTHQ